MKFQEWKKSDGFLSKVAIFEFETEWNGSQLFHSRLLDFSSWSTNFGTAAGIDLHDLDLDEKHRHVSRNISLLGPAAERGCVVVVFVVVDLIIDLYTHNSSDIQTAMPVQSSPQTTTWHGSCHHRKPIPSYEQAR